MNNMKITKKDSFYTTQDATNNANTRLYVLFKDLSTYYGETSLLDVVDYPEDEGCDIGDMVTMYKKMENFTS